MKKLFLAASGLFAAIPGIAVIGKGIGTPPNYEILFGGVIEAFGTLSLLVLWANRNKLKKIKTPRITKLVIRLGVLSFISLIIYIGLFKYCVISHPTHDTAYFPLWTSGELAKYVERTGGRWAALERYGIYPIESAIQKMPPYAIIITTALLLFMYQMIFTSLTVAFGLLGFHKGKSF